MAVKTRRFGRTAVSGEPIVPRRTDGGVVDAANRDRSIAIHENVKTVFGSDRTTEVRNKILESKIGAANAVAAVRFLGDDTVVAELLGTSPRTLARKVADRKSLDITQADRLYRVLRIVDLAIEMIGDRKSASSWLGTSNRALGGETPIRMLITEAGTSLVEESLYAISYGGVG